LVGAIKRRNKHYDSKHHYLGIFCQPMVNRREKIVNISVHIWHGCNVVTKNFFLKDIWFYIGRFIFSDINKMMFRFGLLPLIVSFVFICTNYLSLCSEISFLKGRKLFFDFGANDGSSVKYFVTGENGGTGKHIEGSRGNDGFLRSKYFGQDMFQENHWNLFVFEANNRHTIKLNEQRNAWLKDNKVQSYNLFNGTAITTVDGHLNFTFDVPSGDAGASLMTDSNSARNEVVQVVAVDVNTLFKKLQLREEDYVVIKMDIEGAEFDVVKRIIAYGWLPYIDKIAVEWCVL
jgi:FkbM family methyltransferase